MKKIFWMVIVVCVVFAGNLRAEEIDASALKLTPEQNQKLVELKNNLKAEVQPIWEEIESGQQRITEIEKKYFGEFWNMLTEEQKQEFTKLNQGK